MTNEEAIKNIQDFTGWFKKNKPIYKALEMAIKALNQEPCDDNRLYIKVYADLEPQEKAEKLYQICEEDELKEVYKELGEYCDIEPCDDVVSRQAVLKIIDGWYEQNRDTENIEDLIVLITYMDSVRPQEQTGHWKRISMDRYTTHAQYWYECDKCGEHNLGNKDFCPNCGAKMERSDKG